eukprot:6214320-Pleurochrysis_carterae.AAC.2
MICAVLCCAVAWRELRSGEASRRARRRGTGVPTALEERTFDLKPSQSRALLPARERAAKRAWARGRV